MDEKLTSGRILAQAFSAYFGNFLPFSVICLVVLSPQIVLTFLQTEAMLRDPSSPYLPAYTFLGFVVQAIAPSLATAAVTYGVFRYLRGNSAAVGDALRTGFRRLLPVIGVSLVVGVITALGMFACLIPGFIAAATFGAAVPTAVIEKTGVGASLTRSRELTRGHRWTVFGVIFGLGILTGLVTFAIALLAETRPWLSQGLLSIVIVLSTGLQASAYALVYYNLRRVKESIDVEELAAVFD